MTGNEMAVMASIAVDMQNKEVNDVLDKIRTEITNDIHKCNNTDMAFGMQHTLDIIDKYKS